jgi:hypothetical protein
MTIRREFYGWRLVAVLWLLDFMNMGFPLYGGAVIKHLHAERDSHEPEYVRVGLHAAEFIRGIASSRGGSFDNTVGNTADVCDRIGGDLAGSGVDGGCRYAALAIFCWDLEF